MGGGGSSSTSDPPKRRMCSPLTPWVNYVSYKWATTHQTPTSPRLIPLSLFLPDLASTQWMDEDMSLFAINGLSEKYGSPLLQMCNCSQKIPFLNLATVRTWSTTEEMPSSVLSKPILSTSTTSSSPQVLLATSQPRIQDNRNNHDRDARHGLRIRLKAPIPC
ncbi:hypothetical protein Tco_0852159 [Tanacetum coccineum]